MNVWASSFKRPSSGILRLFCPIQTVDRIENIDLESLWASGKRLLLLDVDKTIVEWKQETIKPPVLAWTDRAKAHGFEIKILSNTRHPERLERLASKLGVEAFRGRFKPSRQMYLRALDETKLPSEAAIMIGDQMMTDILGASRSGIQSIWVKGLPGPEFFGTKFNRGLEFLINLAIQKFRI